MKKNRTIKSIGLLGIATSAIAGSLALSAPGATAAEPAPKPTTGTVTVSESGQAQPNAHEHVVWAVDQVSPMHVPSFGFNTYFFDGVSWRATVTIDSGRSGAWTHCSDGTDIHGPLQGPGFWDFGGSCSSHGTITQYGWYDG